MSGRRADDLWNHRLEIADQFQVKQENLEGRSYYYRLANMMKVADIMEPLGPNLKVGDSTKQSQAKLLDEATKNRIRYDPNDRISLVYDNETLVGFTTMNQLAGDTNIGENGTIEKTYHTVTKDTDIYYFLWKATIIDSSPHLVFHKTEYIGSVNINSFSKLPFRLVLLALILQFEEGITKLLVGHPDNAWAMVPENNKRSAERIYTTQYGRSPDLQSAPALLDCLLFSTKCNILKEIDRISINKFGFDLNFLDLVIKIRNNCAHSAPDEIFMNLLDHRSLWEFTRMLQSFNHELAKIRWDGINLNQD